MHKDFKVKKQNNVNNIDNKSTYQTFISTKIVWYLLQKSIIFRYTLTA